MHDDQEQDWDPSEREIFRSLSSGGLLSGRLEDRVVGALKDRGLIAVSRRSPWRRLIQAGAVAAALAAAFFLGTQYGKREGYRAVQAQTPTSIHAPADHPRTFPAGRMLTAFHMDQDHPLASDPGDYGQDPLGISGKPFEP